MRKAVSNWHEKYAEPFVFYFHVWELDPQQPRINAASSYNQVRHYRKLDKMEWIIKENLQFYDFCGAAEFLGVKDELRITNYKKKVYSSKLTARNPKNNI